MVTLNVSTIRPAPALGDRPQQASSGTHARVRILQTADRLFSAGGIHTIGVDRIIAETHVTKATLYKYFPSKDALIVAYLRDRDQRIRDTITRLGQEHETPAACLRALVSLVAAESIRPDFTGCPFINTTAQFDDPDHPARTAISEHRAWYARTVENLFRGSGHPRPADARDEFFLARDGLYSSANLGDPHSARRAFLRSIHRVISETVQ